MKSLPTLIGGKAQNLLRLKAIPGVSVPPFTVVPAGSSKLERAEIISNFLCICKAAEVAVRSSAVHEDSAEASFAGMYVTKLGVPAIFDNVVEAIEEVQRSGELKKEVAAHYAKEKKLTASEELVATIVQEMIHPDLSGVIFSHSIDACDGYYLISVAQGLGEAIVGGSVNGKLIRVARALCLDYLNEDWLAKLIKTMRKIETCYGSESLDVEFVYANGTLHILQCRPITTSPTVLVKKEDEHQLMCRIALLEAEVNTAFADDAFGDMTDINPLELLGSNPTELDISIFKHLFADTIVERVRREMGYDPLDIGLLRVIGGKPYISLRASAFSLRPKGIPTQAYERMFNVYRRMLMIDSNLQSRVEFDVYAMSSGEKLERIMREAELSSSEQEKVRDAFRLLDSSIAAISEICSSSFKQQIADYADRNHSLQGNSIEETLAHVAKGTELFVRVARLAFYWKNKFEENYPNEDLNELIVGHIQSVNSRLQADLISCQNSELSREELVRRYGHLQPGQFEIFGESYADDPDHYLFAQLSIAHPQNVEKKVHKFEDAVEFRNVVTFMQAREETKFLFSQSLYIFTRQLKTLLREGRITRSQASCLKWLELKALLAGQNSSVISAEKNNLPLILPDVIIPGTTKLGVITFGEARPKYVTQSVVKAPIRVLDRPDIHVDVRGALVLIPNADPGYDFVFHSGAVGIITKVGGPASHMCIMTIELQLPACIGCGEHLYNALRIAPAAVLDCASKQIIPM